ncbi:GNAT family N-acetyltransferase [Jeotgalibacillus salarius]|uniref:N-acetyltransferase domain-containing protein n=1 Tax=Jeotgalibacillus salarius TaxID=546023 RepID=A0A4Y8LC76_9BACL|nr:GNAT family N-acetyltransferase [Jeotgalibacillus salarius]TFD99770.1 hypothetical protein E2626_13380 [Jeotgalibacillus salarius]
MDLFIPLMSTLIFFFVLFYVIRSAVTEGINRSVIGRQHNQNSDVPVPQRAERNYSLLRGGKVITFQKAKASKFEPILSLLKNCAEELQNRGIKQWSYLLSGGEDAKVRKDIEQGNTYAVYEKDELIGTFTLKKGPESWDEHIWKDRVDHDALYLHRLAVSSDVRKEGVGVHAFHGLRSTTQEMYSCLIAWKVMRSLVDFISPTASNQPVLMMDTVDIGKDFRFDDHAKSSLPEHHRQ